MSTVTDYEPRTYRGSDLDELLPKIREELGADAMVVRQREGLQGGVGGFFQKRCVEVVARRATPHLNAYDNDGRPSASASESPAIREIMRVASPFVDQLQAANAEAVLREPVIHVTVPEPVAKPVAVPEPVAKPVAQPVAKPVAVPEPVAKPEAPVAEAPAPVAQRVGRELLRVAAPQPAPRTGAAAAHERALVAAGIAPELAAEIVATTVTHGVPFAPNRAVKHLVRDALAARIPVPAPPSTGRRTIAFVGAGGAGKTLCATRLAEAYTDGSDFEVRLLDLAGGEPPEPAAVGHVLTVVDTPALSPASGADARALMRALRGIGPCEVHVAVPATLSAPAVRRLLDGLGSVKPAAIVLTHLDEVDHAGPVIDAAIARGLPLSFCCDADGLVLADPAVLAAQVLS
jgi:flagellar biosynthesis GTPase FlhF